AVGELAARFPVSRPAISQHLAVLRAAGLVEAATVDGRRAYRLRPEGVGAARAALEAVAAELPEEAGDGGAAERVAVELGVAAGPAAVCARPTEPGGVERRRGDAAGLDPRPGGFFRVVVGGDAARGGFVHVDPPHRVAFTWGREGDEGPLGPGA